MTLEGNDTSNYLEKKEKGLCCVSECVGACLCVRQEFPREREGRRIEHRILCGKQTITIGQRIMKWDRVDVK